MRAGRASLAFVAVAAQLVLFPASALAQAWGPFRGEGSLSLIFQQINLDGHFDTDGSRLPDCAPSDASILIAALEYGLTDKLAISAGLPYVASKFTGSADESCTAELRDLYDQLRRETPAALTSLDTGSYYSTFQDFNLTLRYNIVDRVIAVTPVIGATIPSHHYRTVGEAAPGQDRLALHLGVNVGRLLDPVLPGGYLHARYAYSFVQPLFGISLNRSSAEFEAGYAVTPTVVVRGLAAWQQTHGGITYSEAVERGFGSPDVPSRPEVFLDHDRLLANRYWHVGGGATVMITDSIDLNGGILTFVSGADSHYGIGLTLGTTWRFHAPKLPSPSIVAR